MMKPTLLEQEFWMTGGSSTAASHRDDVSLATICTEHVQVFLPATRYVAAGRREINQSGGSSHRDGKQLHPHQPRVEDEHTLVRRIYWI